MRIRTILLAAVALAGLALPVAAKTIPAILPDPDGKPGDPTKPVKVYILAGQSNMVGMGEISGARCPYTGIFLTADPAAPKGPWSIWQVGNYRVAGLGLYTSARPDAPRGAKAWIYKGTYDPAADYDKARPVETTTVPLGSATGRLPSVDGPHTVVVRGFLEVPETGQYTLQVGHGDSACNVTVLDGKTVYRKTDDRPPAKQAVTLEAGKRYPLAITYLKGGSTALWLSRQDLLGQGDLETVTKRQGLFPWLVDDKGAWTVRKDVYFYDARIHFKGSNLTATSNGRTIGPELGFGHVMGTFHDEQVLLIKTAMGNRALGFDFRPPSSGRTDPDNKWESLEYKLMIEGVRKTLNQIDKIVPGYKGQGYEIAGFVWWQGHKDSFVPALIAEYEKNLVNLIQDVRKEFNVPRMPVVVATVGFGGHRMLDKFQQIFQAQMAVADPARHPELAGTVATVDIRDFWRPADQSPANQDYHYNRNAETYMRVGDALGRAMVKLLGGQAEPLPQPARPPTAPVASAPEDWNKPSAQAALRPIVLDGIIPAYIANPRYQQALLREVRGEKPQRVSQFLRGPIDGLINIYHTVGIHDYDWHDFGPDMKNSPWDYFSFDPPEKMPKDKPNRYRKVTMPAGMENWFAADFDAAKAGWKKGLPPFGQVGGKPVPLRDTCADPSSLCGCGWKPRTLWEKEVLCIRGTFKTPPLKPGYRYRIVIGGSNHVNAGEGYALYLDGKLLAESKVGVGKRQGGQPRGGHIYQEFRPAFSDGKVTVAVMSFLRYTSGRGPVPPQGHLTVWLQEQKIPPILLEAKTAE